MRTPNKIFKTIYNGCTLSYCKECIIFDICEWHLKMIKLLYNIEKFYHLLNKRD